MPDAVEDILGERPKSDVESILGPKPLTSGEVALGGANFDEHFSNGSVGHLLNQFGVGAQHGWGTTSLGLNEQQVKDARQYGIFNDYEKSNQSIIKSFNEHLLRGTASVADMMLQRLPMAAYYGLAKTLEPIVPRDILGMPEAFPLGRATGFPHLNVLERWNDVRALGTEDQYFDKPAPTEVGEIIRRQAPTGIETPTERVMLPEPVAASSEVPQPTAQPAEITPPVPDVHTRARQIAPETFADYDELTQQHSTYNRWLDELGEVRKELPQAREAAAQIDDILGKVGGREIELTNAAKRRLESARTTLNEALNQDTPDMVQVRKELQAADERLRDMAPDVSKAYKQARQEIPEPAIVAPDEVSSRPSAKVVPFPKAEEASVSDTGGTTASVPFMITAAMKTNLADRGFTPEQIRNMTPAGAHAILAETPIAASPREVANLAQRRPTIAAETQRILVEAGRPVEEARVSAALVQAHYEARAAWFEGARGTARYLYDQDAPNIRAGEGPTRGRFSIGDVRNTITLMGHADASTFIHEAAHQWLQELLHDAAHELAPEQLKADVRAIQDWVGAGTTISRANHEQFARGFERYLMEGRAPTPNLATVFEKFRQWLQRIYQTVSRLRSPITADIRGVYDRMLSSPNREPVIAPDRGEPTTFADLHEADAAAAATPADALERADQIRAERDFVATALREEINRARIAARQRPPQRVEERANVLRAGTEGGPESIRAGAAAEPTAVSEGRVNFTPKGDVPRDANAAFDGTDTRLIDKDGKPKLEAIDTSDDIDTVIRSAAGPAEPRVPLTPAQTIDLSSALGMDPAFVNRDNVGSMYSASEIRAGVQLLTESATAVRDAMIKAAEGTTEDVLDMAKAIARHEMLQKKMLGAASEWGYIGKELNRFYDFIHGDNVSQLLKEYTGRDLYQLQLMAKYGKYLPTPSNVSAFVHQTAGGKIRNAVVFYYINSLLSGPITHTWYMIGNSVGALMEPVRLGVASGYTGAMGYEAGDRVYLREAGAALYGLHQGWQDAVNMGAAAWHTGMQTPLPGGKTSVGIMTPPPLPFGAEKILGIPGRSVAAIHSFSVGMRYSQRIHELAVRQAMDEGIQGPAVWQRAAEIMRNPSSDMMDAASYHALKEMYMRPTEYNAPLAALIRATHQNLAAQIFIPFMKIGSEMARNAWAERTPLGLMSSEVRGNAFGKTGGASQGEQLAKFTLGLGTLTSGTIMALNGLMTGDGPPDPDQRRTWLLNHHPNSINIGGLWVPYDRLGPYSQFMRLSAGMVETARYWKGTDGDKLAIGFLETLDKAVLDETFLRSAKDIVEAVMSPGGRNLDKFLNSFVPNWLPFSVGLGQINRKFIDPYQHEVRRDTIGGIIDSIKIRAGFSGDIPYRRDMFGEPIRVGGSGIERYENDPVVQLMDRLQVKVAPPDRKLKGVELSPQQYDDYSREGGRLAKKMLDTQLSSINQLPPARQISFIHKMLNDARHMAAVRLEIASIGKENDILRQAAQTKQDALKY